MTQSDDEQSEDRLSEDVLSFWFGELTGPHALGANQQMWWKKDSELDAKIERRFGSHVERAAAGEYDDWTSQPRGALALIILLDQFSRNIYRQSPRTWENDAKSVALALAAVERGHHKTLRTVESQFLLMPLMHSEELAHHEMGLALIETMLAAVPEADAAGFAGWHNSAKQHADIVRRFGRYPHRNVILGRASSEEELAFLLEPGSSF